MKKIINEFDFEKLWKTKIPQSQIKVQSSR